MNIRDYERMFEIQAPGVALTFVIDLFMGHYRTLGVASIAYNGTWSCFLPKVMHAKTLQSGADLYGNPDAFAQYQADIADYWSRARAFFATIANKPALSRDEFVDFVAVSRENWLHYSKTEHFYTDLVAANLSHDAIRQFEEVKSRGREFMNELVFGEGHVTQAVRKIAKHFGTTEMHVRSMVVEEILALFDGRKIDEAIVERRLAANVFIGRGELNEFLEGESAVQFAQKFFEETGSDEIRGKTANPGVVRGRVAVIPTDYYFNHGKLDAFLSVMKEGDILVAETTSPELFVACKKAAAIVTNQGGLLSHAAIVSRELGIPCIVGAVRATEFLKNADVVEVNATNGTVTILQSA